MYPLPQLLLLQCLSHLAAVMLLHAQPAVLLLLQRLVLLRLVLLRCRAIGASAHVPAFTGVGMFWCKVGCCRCCCCCCPLCTGACCVACNCSICWSCLLLHPGQCVKVNIVLQAWQQGSVRS
jgi:hypothetical protein